MTDYVATRWYRAPEILAGSSKYEVPVDLWSLGCIFGEMLGGKPVFPGTSTLDQLEKIGEALGRPNATDLEGINSPFACEMLDEMKFPPIAWGEKAAAEGGGDGSKGDGKIVFRKSDVPVAGHRDFDVHTSWVNMYPRPKAEETAIELLMSLMRYDPRERVTAEDGLVHAYCSQFHEPATEFTFAMGPDGTGKLKNAAGETAREPTRDAEGRPVRENGKVQYTDAPRVRAAVEIETHDNKKLSTQKYRELLYANIEEREEEKREAEKRLEERKREAERKRR